MNNIRISLRAISIAFALFAMQTSQAANLTWTGEGADNFWSTPANWGGTAPAAGDSLFFGGNVRNTPVNDFPAGTLFGGITFNNPSAAFSIAGNGITLGGDIADSMIVVPQTFNVALTLNGTRTIGVVESGSLILGGVISGPHGLAKINEGQLTLGGVNTFSGAIIINEGTLTVGSDSNLGAVPGAPTVEKIAIDGTLRATATFTLNANRGIAVGPSANTGDGTVFVNSGAVLTYGGIIANNDSGIGGLSKSGFGGLTLFGANTYGGPTAIKNGTLTLDFTQASSPANNIINSGSSLSLGGENAGTSGPGGGTVSFANLTVNGKAGASSAQTFTGTTIDLGPAVIRAANGSGGSVNLNLGTLSQNPGGAVAFITPAITGGSGAINTTTLNDHGILGGWATIGGGTPVINNIVVSTNWASAGPGGSIIPYSGFNVAQTAVNLFGNVPSGANVLISNDSTGDITNNVDEAGTLTEVNSILFSRPVGFTINVGSNNTIRLGKSGGIFKSDATASATYVLGSGGTGTANGVQDQGTLTAGGAPDTPGEIVFTINSSSQTAGSLNTEVKITDNGTGPVRVIKTGPGPMKLRGHNTFSGGMYIIQGRIQMAGSELSGTGGTANPDGFGSGPVYVLPGGQAFPSGAGFITNDWYIAGNGVSDQVGAIRLSGIFSSNITLIGDSRIGGGGFATGVPMYGKITGPFNLDFGATGNSGGGANGARLFNQSNDWTGDTTIVGRTGGTAGNTRLALGASDVIPDGFGKGNLILGNGGNNISQCVFDLNGFNETINGLISAGNAALDFVQNGAASTTSILTLGNNDQSGTFAGIIQSGAGVLAITKIGRGKQVLTGINTYTGITTVSNGTLAVSGAGSIAASSRIVVDGGTLDVSEVSAGFTHGFPVDVINGSLTIRSTVSPGIASLNLTDARVRVTSLGATPITVETSGLLTGGATNLIDVVSVGNISGYPAQFTIIKYAGFIDGLGFNFGLGSVPTPSTVGYISNNVDNSSIDLVLLDGPKPLTWTGATGNNWNINTSINWLAFAGTPSATPSVYLDVDLVRFDDSSLVNAVNLTTTLQPSATVVSNNAVNYTFTGPGKISGATGITKEGSGTLILDNTGTNDFLGPLAINAGTVQLGNGTTGGSFGAGAVVNNGTLAFARSDNAAFNTAISGTGTLRQDGPGVLTLSGNSTFTGPTVVAQSTLKAGSGTAFGTADNSTTVNSGATLDVNGQNLTGEPVVVSGSGVGGNGAIINTGADQLNALRTVTLAGDVVLGGTSRWDIRNAGGAATLNSGASPFKITKVGPNQVSLVGVTVDTALGEIEIQQGNFSVQTTTTQLGDASAALLVHGGATLGLFGLNAVPLLKAITLRDQARVWSENGSNIINGQIVLEGTAIFDVANAGTTPTLIVNAEIGGAGGLVKVGSGRMVMNGPFSSYAGTTVISNGTLLVDGIYSEFGTFNVQGGTLGGVGTITGPLVVHSGGTLAPGNVATPIGTLTLGGAATLSGTSSMDVSKSGGTIANDSLTTLDAMTLGGTLSLNLSGEALADGDAMVLFGFNSASGSFTSIVPATPGPGLTWDTSDLATAGTLRVLAPPQLEFGSVSQSGTNLVMMGRNGTPGATFRILTSPDLETPTPNWVPVATNMFDLNGNFNVTQGIDPGTPKRFFLIQLQQ